MSSAAQITANIENAKSSTGPRTEAGKSASSRNAITHGLFALNNFIRPVEVPEYGSLCKALFEGLQPRSVLEHTLVDEILRATWRLRRCGQVEATMLVSLASESDYILDPMQSETTSALQASVDRARAQSHRILHKCTAELRKLQTERSDREIGREPGERQQDEPDPQPESVEKTTPNTPAATRTQSEPAQTPRNAPCPCGSGQKHKRCCGRSAPPVLQAA